MLISTANAAYYALGSQLFNLLFSSLKKVNKKKKEMEKLRETKQKKNERKKKDIKEGRI